MKKININIIMLSFLINCTLACKSKMPSIEIEKIPLSLEKNNAYILDYTFADDGGEKDTLLINYPISFRLINKSNEKLEYGTVRDAGYSYIPYAIINGKKYNTLTLPEKIYINPKNTSIITYFFQTPIHKKILAEELQVSDKIFDKKMGDSINIPKLTSKIQTEIDKNQNKDMFIISLIEMTSKKNIGIRYCFNKDKAIIYDIDSLVKVNPQYKFSCD